MLCSFASVATAGRSRPTLKEEWIMLVLSRKLGQRFQMGSDIRVTIVKIDRNSIRIGIEAPDDVTIRREEIAALPFDPPADIDAEADTEAIAVP
jgi:carbon storage regulator